MSTSAARLRASKGSISGSSRPADTSLTMRAPESRQAPATVARRVSIETSTPCLASRSTTGRTRRSSSSAQPAREPGRVDSPPTSTMSAPSETKRRPSSTACATSRRRPPSENESGVTFRIAMTLTRSSVRPAKLLVKCPAVARGWLREPGPSPGRCWSAPRCAGDGPNPGPRRPCRRARSFRRAGPGGSRRC